MLAPGEELPAPVAEAAREPQVAQELTVTTVESATTQAVQLSVEAPAQALADPGVTYPVVVDPGYFQYTHFDTTVQSDTNFDQSGEPELKIGGADGRVARSFLTFDIGALQDTSIVSAGLWLYNHHSYSCQAREWQVWHVGPAGNGTRWNAQPPWYWHGASSTGTQGYGTGACGDGWVTADVATMLQRALDEGVQDVTWGLRAANEQDAYAWKKFASADNGDPRNAPHINVTYNNRPENAQGRLQMSDVQRADGNGKWQLTSLTPTLEFTPRDPDGGPVGAGFSIYEGERLVADYGTTVGSGDIARWKVPAGVLQPNRSYKWRATTHDGRDWSRDAYNSIIPMHSGKAVDVAGCSVWPGADVIQYDNAQRPCQLWAMTGVGEGNYVFSARHSPVMLAQQDCGTAGVRSGTDVRVTWADASNRCGHFFYERLGNDSDPRVRLRSRVNTHAAVDVWGTSRDNGANVLMWEVNGSAAQEYKVVPVGDSFQSFHTDTSAPGAPFVDSLDYPSVAAWSKGGGQPGTFTFKPAAGEATTSYHWALNGGGESGILANGPNAVSVTITPAANGPQTLRVTASDAAGNRSQVATYTFNVGRAGIVAPKSGHQAVRKVKVSIDADTSWDKVQYVWRRGDGVNSADKSGTGGGGPASDAPEQVVPAGQLTRLDGTPVTADANRWVTYDEVVRAAAVWDAGASLGFTGGPVQIKAVLRDDANGSTFTTPWVSMTVDPDADGAATTDVGPGSVNLLTGDHTLTSEDVSEGGLSVSRVASSRVPGAGWQPQAEQLSANQVGVGTDTTGFVGVNATTTRDAGRGRAAAGALQITPTAGASATNAYAALGADSGLTSGMAAGKRYRVSGWVYVPAATGGTGPTTSVHRLAVATRTGGTSGSWTTTTSGPVHSTDAWQQLSMDITVPAGATDAVVRLVNGTASNSKPIFFDDLSVRRLWSPFGPSWAGGTLAEDAETSYTQLVFPEAALAQVDGIDGSSVWFTKTNSGQWWPESGAEGMTLVAQGDGSHLLTEIDGTRTVFAQRGGTGPWLVTSTVPPVEVSSTTTAKAETRYVYEMVDGVTRIARVAAPAGDLNPAGCLVATGAPARGCIVMQYEYATATTATATALGNVAGQVSGVQMWTTDPTTGAVGATAVARYRYDSTGRLAEVWDPRVEAAGAPALKTTYRYDNSGRITTATPAGELPWTFTYGASTPPSPSGFPTGTTNALDYVDPNPGRLLDVRRASLQPGTTTTTGPVATSTLVYGVPTTRRLGGPYNLDAPAIATWGQVEAPTDATAVFGPDTVPGSSTATATAPGADGYRAATVHYLSATGQELNTASPPQAAHAVTGFIDSVTFDRWGNTVATLDATNRLLALRELPGAADQLATLGLGQVRSADAARALSATSTYSADGLLLLREVGPTQRLAIGNDPSTAQPLRDFTEYVYDEGRPDGIDYRLVTTETEGVLTTTGTRADVVVTQNGYNPIDGASPIGPTSGWKHGQPTTITVDATGLQLTSTLRYDGLGGVLESRRPGSTGTDASTVVSAFYTAGAHPTDAACGNRPEWSGLPCSTANGGPVTGHDPARAGPSLPVKRVTGYNRWLNPTVVTESAPATSTTAAQTRTTTTTYDAADRVTSVTITGTGPGMDATVTKTVSVYDPTNGDVVETRAVAPDGTVTSKITKTFDALGRLTRYDDGTGNVTTTVFDVHGKPTKVTDSLGTTTDFTYDRTLEPRGLATTVTDSVAGPISATYGPDEQLLTQTLPGQVTLTTTYDTATAPVAKTYTRPDGPDADTTPDVLASSRVVENGAGQWLSHTTDASAKTYGYDNAGRLTDVRDTTAGTGTTTCTWRQYGWNNRAGRTSTATTRTTGGACTNPTGAPAGTGPGQATRTSYTYDSGDRLMATAGAQAGTYTYDPLGRITTAPVATNPGAVVKNAYYPNDMVAAQQIDGVAKMSWTLDSIQRLSRFEEQTWTGSGWAGAVTKVNHYDSDSDSPAWIAEDTTLPDEVTRYVDGLDGDLALQTGKTGDRVLQLVDLHGDVMTTLPIRDGAAAADWAGLRHQATDEFGNPTDLTTGATTASTGAAPDQRYNWLGGKQRSAQALAGVILMGARLYDPATGRFWSVDPEPGGNATAYDYCSGDPVNCTDLDGRRGRSKSRKRIFSKVAKVAEYASWIPGPVGAAAGVVGALAYARNGNKRAALRMGLTAAASLVGAGAAVKGLSKIGSQVAKAGKRCRSFVPGTPVLTASGALVPIESLEVGDLVWTTDPVTGASSAQPVLQVLTGTGDRHVIGINTGGKSWTQATAGHPYWVDGHGWTDAENVEVGDRLRTRAGIVTVQATHDYGWLSGQTVHNLHVANTHTYYAGDDAALVHNASCMLGNPKHAKVASHTIYVLAVGKYRYVGRSKNTVAVRYAGKIGKKINGNFTRMNVLHTRQVRGCVCAARKAEQRTIDYYQSDSARARGLVLLNRRQEIARKKRFRFGLR